MSVTETFTTIHWEAAMTTGIEAIDRQHQYLVDTLREANQKLLHSENAFLLNQIAKDLLSYAITHFETEEALMQRFDYHTAHPGDAKDHIAQHRNFSRQVVTLCDQLREGREVSRIEILRFLNHWLKDHVLGIDQKLGAYLRAHSSNQSSD